MFPRFRFTLSNDTEGSLVIDEPGGWDTAKLKLARDKKYHSLIEFYEQPLTFYGETDGRNGGIGFIQAVENTQGPDADITITIEVDFGDGYEDLVTNLLDLAEKKEISVGTEFYKMDVPVIRQDFWSKFINREDTPVDSQSATDLDGNAVDVVDPLELTMTPQIINKTSRIKKMTDNVYEVDEFLTSLTLWERYVQLGIDYEIQEIVNSYTLPLAMTANQTDIVPLIEPTEAGEIEITVSGDVHIEAATSTPTTDIDLVHLLIYYQLNSNTPVVLDSFIVTGLGTNSYSNTSVPLSASVTLPTIAPGDTIKTYLWYRIEAVGSCDIFGSVEIGTLTVEFSQKSETPESTSESMLIYDVANSIAERIAGVPIYSDFFGGALTSTVYDADGCGYPYVLMKGLHAKGYTFAEKPFSKSFDDLWKGIDPIFCLGLGYEPDELSPEGFRLRIEERGHFYDGSSNSVNLDFINKIEKSYATDRIFKKIKIGYQKGDGENISGIDDPQKKHVYAADFRKTGEEINLESNLMAASLAIEGTRRQSIEKSKDYRLDNETFIINIQPNASPIVPALDEDFSSVTGLNNPETRYNIKLTPARNFIRFISYLSSSFYPLLNSLWTFVSGEGNVTMSSASDDPCNPDLGDSPDTVEENQNIEVATSPMTLLEVWDFEHYLTWDQYKTIRENRNKSVGLSQTDSDHEPFFILSLEYEITHGGRTKFTMLKAPEGEFLLMEDSSLFVLEDDSGFILLE